MPRIPALFLPTALTLLIACPSGSGSGAGSPSSTDPNPCAGTSEWYRDQDNDGYGTSSIVSDDCEAPLGYVERDGDCNDDNPLINPDMVELCDPLDADEDCSGAADNDDPTATGTIEAWVDNDMDGFGSEGATEAYCDLPATAAQNNLDCDDNEGSAWPGSAFEDSVLDCMKDTDGDGWGDDSTTGDVLPGTDCSDNDPGAYPLALETWTDGIDQDCNGIDDFALMDSFETGAIEPAIWAAAPGSSVTSATAAIGDFSLLLGGGDSSRTVAADTTLCVDLIYSIRVKRGLNSTPTVTDRLSLQYRTSLGNFVAFDAVVGTGSDDTVFVAHSGAITNVDAYHTDFALRLESIGNSDFVVDEVFVGCPGEDLDGDGVAGLFDCDDTTDEHWADCGVCVDADGDGYGQDCDLGGDCDDGDATRSPVGPDAPGDGIDTNCDGWDGVVLLATFELGQADPSVWDALGGDAVVSNSDPVAAAFSLELGTAGDSTTRTFDATLCPTVTWRYVGRRGPAAPLATGSLTTEYWDGAAWQVADTWYGSDFNDNVNSERSGEITDPALLISTAQLRFVSDAPSGGSFFIDDVVIGCPLDIDGDGRGVVVDCDDTDPDHYSDCNLCVDMDGDGFGLACDLGPDCDDTDPTTNPAGTESPGDGLDQNCDGIDAVGVLDGFESGQIDGATWATVGGTADVVEGLGSGGRHSLALRGDGASTTSVAIDTRGCAGIAYRWAVKRGPEVPDIGEVLSLQLWDGVAFVTIDSHAGAGIEDLAFDTRLGVSSSPAFLRADLQARLQVTGGTPGEDVFYIDDLVVVCGDDDRDGDGWPPPIDCDDTNRLSWSDCWSCIDDDMDGFGSMCDGIEEDCDDTNPLIYPGALDDVADGIDYNCDGFDEDNPWVDGFEIGYIESHWQSGGDASWSIQASTVWDGAYAIGGGQITNNESTNISMMVTYYAPGSVSFWHTGDTETGWDFFSFYVDGVQQETWSGYWGWTRSSHGVSEGTHKLEWIYDKDASVSVGADTAWIDLVSLTNGTP
jgi:hypothetical protein